MKLHRRRKKAISVPTTSMGDIAFLLIIFFMVCSNFVKESGIKVAPPLADDIDSVKNAPLSVVIDENNEIHVNGKPVSSGMAVEAIVESAVEGKTTDDERMVLFKCDRSVAKTVFEPVLEAITRAGGMLVAVGEKRAGN